MTVIEITELRGDGIGRELEEAIHTVAETLPIELSFDTVDWTVETRERLGVECIDAAEQSMRRTRLAVKYPTATVSVSPNALIRRRCELSVIYRPCISIKGISSHFKENVVKAIRL